jgi:hypothetical protein
LNVKGSSKHPLLKTQHRYENKQSVKLHSFTTMKNNARHSSSYKRATACLFIAAAFLAVAVSPAASAAVAAPHKPARKLLSSNSQNSQDGIISGAIIGGALGGWSAGRAQSPAVVPGGIGSTVEAVVAPPQPARVVYVQVPVAAAQPQQPAVVAVNAPSATVLCNYSQV